MNDSSADASVEATWAIISRSKCLVERCFSDVWSTCQQKYFCSLTLLNFCFVSKRPLQLIKIRNRKFQLKKGITWSNINDHSEPLCVLLCSMWWKIMYYSKIQSLDISSVTQRSCDGCKVLGDSGSNPAEQNLIVPFQSSH